MKASTLLRSIFILILLVLVDCQDREPLLELYNNTQGDNWNIKWNTTNHYCSWSGVYCDSSRSVINLMLKSYNLVGTLPVSIANLTQLVELDLSQNWLNGSIPSSIGFLTKLSILRLAHNQLVGTIPTQIGHLTNLRYLECMNNSFNGDIPTTIGHLTLLSTLDLSFNQLAGTIPSEIGNLFTTNKASLVYEMYLNNNLLTGTIPSTIVKCLGLDTLLLNGNNLTGTIPPQMGTWAHVDIVALNDNRLSGTIPSLSRMNSLNDIYFQGNMFCGGCLILPGRLDAWYFQTCNVTGIQFDCSCSNSYAIQSCKLECDHLKCYEGGPLCEGQTSPCYQITNTTLNLNRELNNVVIYVVNSTIKVPSDVLFSISSSKLHFDNTSNIVCDPFVSVVNTDIIVPSFLNTFPVSFANCATFKNVSFQFEEGPLPSSGSVNVQIGKCGNRSIDTDINVVTNNTSCYTGNVKQTPSGLTVLLSLCDQSQSTQTLWAVGVGVAVGLFLLIVVIGIVGLQMRQHKMKKIFRDLRKMKDTSMSMTSNAPGPVEK